MPRTIVDYESSYDEENKVKYLSYVARVIKRIYNDYKSYETLRVIIIYTADEERRQTKPVLDIGGMRMNLTVWDGELTAEEKAN